MYHLIKIKHLGATSTKGARLKATLLGLSATIPYPHELGYTERCNKAAQAAIDKVNDFQRDFPCDPDDPYSYKLVDKRVLWPDSGEEYALAEYTKD